MNFIQIREGVAIRKSDIIAVEKLDSGGTRVLTLNTAYECPFLYDSILTLLEIEDIETKVTEQQSNPSVNLWGAQHWRG